MTSSIIQATNLTKHYTVGNTKVRALDGLDISIEKGSYIALMGPSGSGKFYSNEYLRLLRFPNFWRIFFKLK